jgi:hypothetical protein
MRTPVGKAWFSSCHPGVRQKDREARRVLFYFLSKPGDLRAEYFRYSQGFSTFRWPRNPIVEVLTNFPLPDKLYLSGASVRAGFVREPAGTKYHVQVGVFLPALPIHLDRRRPAHHLYSLIISKEKKQQ